MILTQHEYRMFERFHKRFFKPVFYTNLKRPDIETFIKQDNMNSSNKHRLKEILALYVFNFWCLAYVIKAPSRAFIEAKFEHYN